MVKKSTNGAARPRRRRAAGAASTLGAADDAGMPRPTHDEIAQAAYQRYLNRGAQHGRDFEDWVQAEQELRERKSE